MTNHRKNRRTRRSQKGGLPSWVPFFGSSEQENPNYPTLWSRISNWGSSTATTIDTQLANAGTKVSDAAGSTFSDIGEGLNSINPLASNITTTTTVPVDSSSTTVPQYNSTTSAYQTNGTSGGRRRRRAKSMKGGKGGLGLTYYASPVSGLKVAEPTTWQYYAGGTNQYSVKGGSRKRKGRKSRRNHRHKKALNYK